MWCKTNDKLADDDKTHQQSETTTRPQPQLKDKSTNRRGNNHIIALQFVAVCAADCRSIKLNKYIKIIQKLDNY